MVQCEMCGAETPSPTTIKIEGAELQVCDDCVDFGTEVTQDTGGSTSTKYSTSSSGSGGSSGTATSSGSSSGGGGGSSSSRRDMFDEMEEIAPDYDERIRDAREAADLTQEELSDSINEKVSLIRKLERGDMVPNDEVQRKLERRLDISLSGGGEVGDEEWESEGGEQGLTLGDMVKRKD
ncbi:MAG: multiprotein bridging factor aMBF1 [Halodesulfurarchaeum sp.]